MSTGLECQIVRLPNGKWYYILEDWDSPKGAWDWWDYASCYGPFTTQDAARTHLRQYHANPGGYGISEYTEMDERLENMVAKATLSPW